MSISIREGWTVFHGMLFGAAFLLAFAVGPVCAKRPGGVRAVFEADMVSESSAINPGPYGEVWIRADKSFKVELKGVPDGDYDVALECITEVDEVDTEDEYFLGTLTVVGGEGKLVGTLPSEVGLCPDATVEAYINADDAPGYVSGFYLPSDG